MSCPEIPAAIEDRMSFGIRIVNVWDDSWLGTPTIYEPASTQETTATPEESPPSPSLPALHP